MRARVVVLLVALLGLLLVPVTAQAAPGDVAITAPGAVGDDTTPLLEGTALPTAEVRISIDGVVVTTLPPQPSGTWSYQVVAPLTGGAIFVVEALVAGVVVGDDVLTYTVRPPLPTVTITSPSPGTTVGPWTTTVAGNLSGGAPVDVELFLDDTSLGLFDGYTDLDALTWVANTLDLTGFASGSYDLTAQVTDAWGRTAESLPVPLVLDADPPVTPVVTSPAAGTVLTDPTPTFTGTGEPGTRVAVIDYFSGEPFAEGAVSVDGTFSITVSDGAFAFAQGQRVDLQLLARSTDAQGNVAFSDELRLVLDLRVAAAPGAGEGAGAGPGAGAGAGAADGSRPAAAAPTRPGLAELAETGPLDLLPATASGLLLVLVGTALVRRAHRA